MRASSCSLLGLVLLLSACLPPEENPCYTWRSRDADPEGILLTLPAEQPAISFHVAAEDPDGMLSWVGANIVLESRLDHDCLVAAYASQRSTSPDDLPSLDAAALPPASTPELGELDSYYNLAGGHGIADQERLYVGLEADGHPAHAWLSIVGCPGGGVEVTLSFEALFCDNRDLGWGEERAADRQRASVERAW